MKPDRFIGIERGRSVVICGAARCLWDDLAGIDLTPHHLCGVNYVPICWTRVFDHWATVHDSEHWFDRRSMSIYYCRGEALANHCRLHGRHRDDAEVIRWNFRDEGTSSLFATRVMLALGYERIILAGVPLDGTGHFYEPPGVCRPQDQFAARYTHQTWEQALPEVRERVRSLSGFTRDLLGAPS